MDNTETVRSLQGSANPNWVGEYQQRLPNLPRNCEKSNFFPGNAKQEGKTIMSAILMDLSISRGYSIKSSKSQVIFRRSWTIIKQVVRFTAYPVSSHITPLLK